MLLQGCTVSGWDFWAPFAYPFLNCTSQRHSRKRTSRTDSENDENNWMNMSEVKEINGNASFMLIMFKNANFHCKFCSSLVVLRFCKSFFIAWLSHLQTRNTSMVVINEHKLLSVELSTCSTFNKVLVTIATFVTVNAILSLKEINYGILMLIQTDQLRLNGLVTHTNKNILFFLL